MTFLRSAFSWELPACRAASPTMHVQFADFQPDLDDWRVRLWYVAAALLVQRHYLCIKGGRKGASQTMGRRRGAWSGMCHPQRRTTRGKCSQSLSNKSSLVYFYEWHSYLRAKKLENLRHRY
jgi:hypothetical protein